MIRPSRLPARGDESVVRVTTVGSGDAFGSGGRFQTCIALAADEVDAPSVLLDCGATSLTALRQQQIDPLQIEAVLVTHLHGDHFGGLPFLVLDAQFRRRTHDLTVFGPPGTRTRLEQAMEILFPGSSSVQRRFAVRVAEHVDRQYGRTGRAARHPVRGAPCLRRTGVRVAR
jgi:ribonuclease BN (tRNA processing enzyme)